MEETTLDSRIQKKTGVEGLTQWAKGGSGGRPGQAIQDLAGFRFYFMEIKSYRRLQARG